MIKQLLALMSLATELLLAGCVLPKNAVREDGTVVLAINGDGTFELGGQRWYSLAPVEIQMQSSMRRTEVKGIDIWVPSTEFHGSEEPNAVCTRLWDIVSSSGKNYRFYEWTPGDKTTVKPVACNVVIVS